MRIFFLMQFVFVSLFALNANAAVYDRSHVMSTQQIQVKGFQPTEKDIKEFTIDPTNVEIVFESSGTYNNAMWRSLTKGGGGGNGGGGKAAAALDSVERIVNIADTIWQVMKDGEPVVNANLKYATAVPDGVESWTFLTNWSRPVFRTYTVTYRNLFNIKVVTFKLAIKYTYNGAYQGRGKFLTAVGIDMLEQTVLWGWNMSLMAEVPQSSIINRNTRENPVAQLTLLAKYNVWTPINTMNATDTFIIDGYGNFKYVDID